MRPLVPFLGLLVLTDVQAQADSPLVDLTMSDNGQGQIELRARAHGHFDGVLAAMTFTLRWPASAGVALDTAVRCYPFQNVLPMDATEPVVNGEWMYRTFNGFGITPLSAFGLAWEEGREYPICTADILIPGTTIELINDEWVNANNSAFFVSLGGWERTGVLYPSPEPDVSISTEDQGTGNLDIILTPEDDFFGWVTTLDFTVRWPAGSGVSLGTVLQNLEVAEYLPIEKVGGEVTADGFTYQVFHGEGVKSIANSDDAWHAGQEVTALSVPIFGTSEGIMVINDDWTTANDGTYLIELNGNGHTGTIEGIAMGVSNVAAAAGLDATVLPVSNGFNVLLNLPNTPKPATFSLHNAAGQAVWSTTREGAHGRMNVLAETGPVANGLYILSVRYGDRSFAKRIVR